MTMRAVGTCRYEGCQQTDLVWEDGYCAEDCREEATGCPVPFCRCAGGCGLAALSDRPVTGEGST
jgi:hypothetical protein